MSLSHLSPIQLIFDILYCGSWLLVMNFTYPYRFSRRVTYLLEIVWLILCILRIYSLSFSMLWVQHWLFFPLFFRNALPRHKEVLNISVQFSVP